MRTAGDWGRPDSNGSMALPPRAPLSMELLSGAGAYLLDNGRMLVLWLGHAVPVEFLSQVRALRSRLLFGSPWMPLYGERATDETSHVVQIIGE